MDGLVQRYISGETAVKIAESIETAVRDGRLAPGDRLPTVRGLARHLSVSPATVASAYRSLQTRGVVNARGRAGTRVGFRPLHASSRRQVVPAGARDLSDGNPDPALLPAMGAVLAEIDPSPCLYGVSPQSSDLVRLMRREMSNGGVATGDVAVVNGAMDGIGRVFDEHLRPGDRIAVEDPGYTGVVDLAVSRGLSLVPVAVDQEGPRPDALEAACREGVEALVVTSRVQSPTGAAVSETRARALRKLLRRQRHLLLIEDDHASLITDAPLECLHDPERERWVYVCSLSKSLNPDLRLAVVTGDDSTMRRILDRQVLGERWVSHVVQRIASALLAAPDVRRHLRKVARTYTQRRQGLIDALGRVGVEAVGSSGYNVWLPVDEETATVQALAAAGWAVAAGERFRLRSPPAIRITASTLEAPDARGLAETLAGILSGPSRRLA